MDCLMRRCVQTTSLRGNNPVMFDVLEAFGMTKTSSLKLTATTSWSLARHILSRPVP